MSLYLLINFFSIAIPFGFSFHKQLSFYKNWYALWPALFVPGAVFIVWDILFTKMGVWGFNPDYLANFYILGLPYEELLFFFCIPYACVFTYASLNRLIKQDLFGNYARSVTWFLIVLLGLLGVLNIQKWYTGVTFISSAFFLLIHQQILNSKYLGRFYLAYLVVFLGPFFLVNGILTGSFIEEPVVWYNNSENLSLRIFTIPVEDFIYGMLLFLMNVTIYETKLARKNQKHG